MRLLFFYVVMVLGSVTVFAADSIRYFPELSHSSNTKSDSFTEEWYSKQLKALGESSLCCGDVTTRYAFRFTWLRTFHHPVAIRLEQSSGGSWYLYTKVTSGAGGYELGKLIADKSRAATSVEVAALAKLFDSGSTFWALPSVEEDDGGFDGSQWIIEVRDGTRYHFVDRWSPVKGQVRDWGLMFMKLSRADFGEVY